MADRGDTHYRVSGLNRWFAFSSALLLITTLWMMLDDWNRPWKTYQRQFRQIEIDRAVDERTAIEEGGALATEEELLAAVSAAETALDGRKSDLKEAEEELRLAKGEAWRIIEDAKKAKSEYNWDRYWAEEHRLHEDDPTVDAEKLANSEQKMNDAMGLQEDAEAALAVAQARVDDLRADVETATSALAQGTRELDRVRKRLEQLDPTSPAARLANVIRDAPGTDFISPSIKVNKVVLQDLTFELNFTKKRRIDMCHTCHLGIENRGFEDQPHPFTTHPRLDLYLTAKSPHPLKDVGCTICHRGAGEALDFVRADHRPNSEEQAADWHDEHHWEKQHHWDYPMLATDFVEASCTQCHKDSMELIAEDAPTVTEGYRLFERYGCYSCHKVDWFPTKRRPGPSLVNFQTKMTEEFTTSWIAEPKAFRPTTWMPQLFHLENYQDEEEVTVSQYGAGRAILGGEWNDAAVAAIAAFLVDRAPKQELPPVPVEGDAERGREVFRVSGCLACHNTGPYGEEEALTNDPAFKVTGENEHGPNLRGVASKVNAEWLFWWIKDPSAYWSETRMPDLRLPDQDIADITAYMIDDPDGIFTDVPAGWDPALVSMPEEQMREVLAEQARWFYAREGRTAIEARLNGEDPNHNWADLGRLKVAVGETMVSQYGCFSCHEIEGMQDMMPIGTELSNWGSKTVDKLDFGFAYQKELGGRPKLDHHYREGWLMRKLHAPRSYDLEKVKNPTEKLRMGYFAFSEEEVQAITTFVLGLVDDEVQRARMVPTPEQAAMDAGLRAVRQKNCMACHMVDPGTITFEDEDGVEHTIAAEFMPFEDEVMPPAHDFDTVVADAEYFEADEVGMRVLRVEPDLDLNVGDKLFIEPDQLRATSAPKGGDFVSLVMDYYFNGIELYDPEAESEDDAYYYVTADPDFEGGVEDVDGVFRQHFNEQYDKIRWTYAPPVLWNEGHKLQPAWFYRFLKDVEPLRHQIRVRMPSFHYSDGEAEAVADYFAQKAVLDWPARFARELRLNMGISVEEMAERSGLDVVAIRGIEASSKPDIRASLPKLLEFAASEQFAMSPAVQPDYEVVRTRQRAYLDERSDVLPGHLRIGENLVTDAVNCYQCHFRLGQAPAADPIAWAPDLAISHERLREDWTLEWLIDPQLIYPGTSMPGNFAGDPPQYQDFYPDSNNQEQLQVVLEWLFNFDRVYMTANN